MTADKTVYVEWNQSPLYTSGILGWVTAAIQLLGNIAARKKIVFQEGQVYETMKSELVSTPTVIAVANRTCAIADSAYNLQVTAHIVDIAAFEQKSNRDLALCMQDVRDEKHVALFVVNTNKKIIILYMNKAIDGNHVICVIDTQTPSCIMHRTIVVYLAACILAQSNPISVDTMDTYNTARQIKERRVLNRF